MNIIPHPRIPDGWRIEHSPQYNCPFYINNYTNESIWTIPTAPAYPVQSAPLVHHQQHIQGYASPVTNGAPQYSSPAVATTFVGGQPTPGYTPLSANQSYFPAQNGQQHQQIKQNPQQTAPYTPQTPFIPSGPGQQAGQQLVASQPQTNQYAPQAPYTPQQTALPPTPIQTQTVGPQAHAAELEPNNLQAAAAVKQQPSQTNDIVAPIAQHAIPTATSDSAPTVVDHLTQVSSLQDAKSGHPQQHVETPTSQHSSEPPPPAYSLSTPIHSPVAVPVASQPGSNAAPNPYAPPIDQTPRDAYGHPQAQGAMVIPQQQYLAQQHAPMVIPAQYQSPPPNGNLGYQPGTQQVPIQQAPVQQVPIQQVSAQYMPVQQVPAQQMPVQQIPGQQMHPQPGMVPNFTAPNGQQQGYPPQSMAPVVSSAGVLAQPPQQQHQFQQHQQQFANPQHPQQAISGHAPTPAGAQSAQTGEKGIMGDLMGAFKGGKTGRPVSGTSAPGGKKQTGLVAGAMAGAIGASAMLGGIVAKAGGKQTKQQVVRPHGAAPAHGIPQNHGAPHPMQHAQGQSVRPLGQAPPHPQGAGRGQPPKAGQAALVGGIAALGIGALALGKHGKAGKHGKHGGGHHGGHGGHGGHSEPAEDQTAYNQDPTATTYDDGSGGTVYYDNSGAAQQGYATEPTYDDGSGGAVYFDNSATQQGYATDPAYDDGSGGAVYYDNSGAADQSYAADPTYVDDTSYADTSYVDDGSGGGADLFCDDGTGDMFDAAEASSAMADASADMFSGLF